MWHPATPKLNCFYLTRQEALEFLTQCPLIKKPSLITTPRHESHFEKNQDLVQYMILYAAYPPAKCIFTRFTSDWKKTALLRIRCLINFDRVNQRNSFLDIDVFLRMKSIIPLPQRWNPPYPERIVLILWQGFSNRIRVRVNNLAGNMKAGQFLCRISLQKCPFCNCISSHHIQCIQQHN